jgi:sensor histidine kinase regulating citrate/malate metabolism
LRTSIFSRPYLASYLPIKNADGNIVGMLSAAKAQNEILETAQQTNRLTLAAVVIIMIIMVMPIYLVTRRLSGEVS